MFELIMGVGILGWYIISDLLNRRERTKLINRIMSGNYKEYQYYEKEYTGDIKTLDKVRQEEFAKKKMEEVVEENLPPREKEFLDGMDEDWRVDQIDTEKLKTMVGHNEFTSDNKANS